MSRAYPVKRVNRHEPACELCRQHGLLVQKLDPVNWQPITRRLCTRHRKDLGFHPIDWGRGTYNAYTMRGDR